jgi:TolB protein
VNWLALALLVGLSAAASAQNPVTIVSAGNKLVPERVAVQRFVARSPEGQALAAELSTALAAGLDFAAPYVARVNEKAFIESAMSPALDSPPPIQCANWSQIGADALVQGQIEVTPEAVRALYRVHDVVKCTAKIGAKRMTGRPENVRRMGKAIADEIVAALTGTPGVADTELAFVSARTGTREIFVMDADGGNQRGATRNRTISTFPSWSSDANSVVYTSYRYRNRPWLFIVARGKTSPGRILTGLPDSTRLYRGVYDPSGTKLAIAGSVDGVAEIFTASAGGGGLKRLTKDKFIDVGPSWSPDGRSIAYVSDRSGAPQIYVMDAEGGNPRRLTYDGAYNTSPAWSPDGRWIAFETRVNGQFDIWKISPEGGRSIPVVSHPRSDEHPTWSPDGRMLAFSSTRYGRADILIVDEFGTTTRRITTQGENTHPSWGPYRR